MKTALWMSPLTGLPLAIFMAVSPFFPMDHSTWLRINDGLVVSTLVGIVILGWRLRAEPWPRAAGALVCYTAVFGGLWMASYLASTWFFADGMQWIPSFYHDYTYHGYTSVKTYLFTGDRYVELAKVQLLSVAIFSVGTLALGGLASAGSRYLGPARGSQGRLSSRGAV